MNKQSRRRLLGSAIVMVPLAGSAWLGCVDVAQERAYRDETVGKGAVAETTFEVVDGLGALRRVEPGAVSLWAQAPSFQINVTRGERAPSAWTLTVSNTLPDAVLEVRTESGMTAIVPESLPRTRSIEKRWELTLGDRKTTLFVRPARGEPVGPWRFALLSDVQEAINRVQDIYARMNADPTISFVVSAGDLTEQGTVPELERFQRELERLRVPFFSTLGNHELGTERGAPFQRYFGRANFSFAYGGMQFTFLDSASATIDPLVYDWLETWIAEGRSRTHAALMHIPPIDPIGVRNGSFASRNEASKLLAQLAEGGVDLTLYGHIHSYYAFSNAGMPAYISGGGGSIPERFDGIGRHYLTVDVDPVGGVTQTALVRVDRD
jgi:3',5'-cyclic-AMP phosphodiesterase